MGNQQSESKQGSESQSSERQERGKEFGSKLTKNVLPKDIELSFENYETILRTQVLQQKQILSDTEKPKKQDFTYVDQLKNSNGINQKKIERIRNELKKFNTNIPVYKSNAIFIAYDARVDVMKSILIGSEDTPYQDGIFLYDIYFPEEYPHVPLKMTLMTTGEGDIRFNPNLYDNGYVCLSILGTWRGQVVETWSPSNSNLMIALMSVQSIVMCQDIYFNEPGFEGMKGKPRGESLNRGYSNIVKYGTIKYGMIAMILNPPPQFKEVILVHFYLKKNRILKMVDKWIEEAEASESSCAYDELVLQHNQRYAKQFIVPGAFKQRLISLKNDLSSALLSIKEEDIRKIIQEWSA